jgi:sialate O-acetylesterase
MGILMMRHLMVWAWRGVAAALLAIVAGSHPCARGDVNVPPIFSSHMVLQRDQKDRVWGWAEPDEEITVKIASQSHATKADRSGSWQIVLDSISAGGPYTLSIQGKNTLLLDDVLVGEVWVCSGQSNMQWSVAAAKDSDLELAAANYPGIRLITVPNFGTQEPQRDFRGQWRPCQRGTAAGFSAIGYFFGRRLHETLNVPVGLINDAWGGSACEAWIRRDLLAADEKYAPLLKRWEELEKDLPKAKADYESRRADWKRAVEKAKAEGRIAPPAPQSPEGLLRGNSRPGNIYNGVLKPTIGYGIRGVIWYQGESNAGRAYQYRDLFPLMIKSWRDEWGQGDFSFYWAQLADFLPETSEPKESAWAELREAQTMTLSRLPATGEAVIIDLGEAQDIHPRNKQDVANRLARLALARDYGLKIAAQSPTYKAMEKHGNKVVVRFDHLQGSLHTGDVPEVRGFAIAGSDRKFVWAKAKLIRPAAVEVWSDQVAEPAAVRYAWADNPVCNLYSAQGLPVTPFRTDDWPGVTIDAVQ